MFETYVYFVRSVQFGRCRHGEHAPGVKFQFVYTCQVQNFTSVHVPDDVKLIISLSKIVRVRGFFASLNSCSIPAGCEKQL